MGASSRARLPRRAAPFFNLAEKTELCDWTDDKSE
jgi:hypothetical protein